MYPPNYSMSGYFPIDHPSLPMVAELPVLLTSFYKAHLDAVKFPHGEVSIAKTATCWFFPKYCQGT
jgi:hypothetical protein